MTTQPRLRLLKDESPAPDGGPGTDAPLPVDADASRALEEVVGRFDGFIRRSAYRHGLTGGDVDDLVQELRVRVWRSLGTAAVIRRAKATYICRAVVSAALDIIRRRRARRFQAQSLDERVSESAPDPRARTDAGLEGSELAHAVHDAVALLVESRRAVVRMYLAGYDRFDIADLLGWTEAKTRNLLYRGLDDLRKILLSRGIGPEGWQ